MNNKSRLPEIFKMIVDLCSKQEGVSTKDMRDICGVPSASFTSAARELCVQGKLIKVPYASSTRYFLDKAAVDQWLRNKNEVNTQKKKEKNRERYLRRIKIKAKRDEVQVISHADKILEQMTPFLNRPEGVSIQELLDITGVCKSATRNRVQLLTSMGLVHRMDYGRKTAYFATEELAEARKNHLKREAIRAHRDRVAESKMRNGPSLLSADAMRRAATKAAVQRFTEMPAVIPENVKIVRATPTYDYRYFVDPSKVNGEFTSEWRALRSGHG